MNLRALTILWLFSRKRYRSCDRLSNNIALQCIFYTINQVPAEFELIELSFNVKHLAVEMKIYYSLRSFAIDQYKNEFTLCSLNLHLFLILLLTPSAFPRYQPSSIAVNG
jgi:hypothetical protein